MFVKNKLRDDLFEVTKIMEYGKEKSEEKVKAVVEELGIEHLLDSHPFDLSGGEQQKAAFAKILLMEPAIAYGMQAGFVTGALSAIVSNIFFGQGPWTPFQMFVWGFLGSLAGLIFKRGQKPNIVFLILIGILGGAAFSVMMDVWSVLNIDGTWNWSRYFALFVSSLPFMAIYAVSNVVFLLLLTKPFLQKLNRVKDKYGLFAAKL